MANNNSDRAIIIKGNGRSIFDGVDDVYDYCRNDGIFIRVFRKLTKKLRISFFEPLFYGEWKTILKECNVVIVFDNDYEFIDKIVYYIKKKGKNL